MPRFRPQGQLVSCISPRIVGGAVVIRLILIARIATTLAVALLFAEKGVPEMELPEHLGSSCKGGHYVNNVWWGKGGGELFTPTISFC